MKILNSLLNKNLPLLFFSLCTLTISSQKIISGPLQGNTTDTSATLWVLTKDNSSISISSTYDSILLTSSITEDLFIRSSFKRLRAYKINLFFKKTTLNRILFQLNLGEKSFENSITMSSKNDSSFFFGSCAYIGKGFSRIYRPWNTTKIFESIANDRRSKYMLWLGDNVYLILNHDLKNKYRIYKRYLGVRKQREMNMLLSSEKQHYSIWDDHDFGPNNCDGDYENATLTTSAFNNFWVNPESKNGVYYSFEKGDVSFIMTDGRTFKRTADSTLLGETQLSWIKKKLLESQKTFKIIVLGNQFINKGYHESFYDFEKERNSLIGFINTQKIPGVLFFSGDRHHSEINVETHQNYYPIHDITCSALSSPRRVHLKRKEKKYPPNTRVKKSLILKHNYGLFSILNDNGKKVAQITFLNKQGETLFSYSISSKNLGH